MRRYEVVFVLAPTLADEEFDQQIETYVEAAKESGAEVVDIDKWGKRRLAFPVQKHNEGFYTVLTLDEPSGTAVAELERRFKVNDAVIRFLSVRIDLELKRAEKFEQRKAARKKRIASKKATAETRVTAEKE
jgi:small subunit ribosomal protein S6